MLMTVLTKTLTAEEYSLWYARFKRFAERMEAENMPSIVINQFKEFYAEYCMGSEASMPESTLRPLRKRDVKEYDELEGFAEIGREHLGRCAVLKLNGGLGTSMGLDKAKSAITVKDGMTFLDIILKQAEALRTVSGVTVPLLLMNSFRTHEETLGRLQGFNNGQYGPPVSFEQHKFPKVLADSLEPASWDDDPLLEWNPPGHGDLYLSLISRRVLQKLLESGVDYLFVSNADNLAAVVDERILGYMASRNLPFLMEVARREPCDKKGGHLALDDRDRLVLREVAQCPDEDMSCFQDIERHRYFNTNSIWLDLRVLSKVICHHRTMPLRPIANTKTLDPRDDSSPKVIQIESAMGSAVSAFYDAAAVVVPRERFAPVKTTSDLLAIMSDCYELNERAQLVQNPARRLPPIKIDLDPRFYKKMDVFAQRFQEGMPSLLDCSSLSVRGDVCFDTPVALSGDNVFVAGDQPTSIRTFVLGGCRGADGGHV
jgi:UTP--glucose-1-phosphate uridylyltransferase